MKIQILSDLHLEFLSPSQVQTVIDRIQPTGDVLVLAGDIGNGREEHYQHFLVTMASRFPKVFVVAGNHEYYGNDMELTKQTIHSLCTTLDNVSFLDSSWEDYGGIRWIGTTLWSHVHEKTKCFTNDIRRIQNFSLAKYNQQHDQSVQFLHHILQEARHQQCIVITHYLPSMELIHDKYKQDVEEQSFNQWFATPLDDLLETHSSHIPLWIYGHTHDASQKMLFQTSMVCNPLGYEGENKNPDWNVVFELDITNKNDVCCFQKIS